MFKVKCTLVAFEGREDLYPCHFNYKIGDTIYYDGDRFTGRICPGLLASMMPVVHSMCLTGNHGIENVIFRYRGHDVRDPSMAKYDGVGFRPVDKPPAEHANKKASFGPYVSGTQKARGNHFTCADTRILAEFRCEAVDLSDCEYAQPFYRREIAVLEKIEIEPGIEVSEIMNRFTDFEKNDISPRLTPVFMEVIMDALTDMAYVEVKDGKAFPTGRQPPSRPKIG